MSDIKYEDDGNHNWQSHEASVDIVEGPGLENSVSALQWGATKEEAKANLKGMLLVLQGRLTKIIEELG